MKIKHIAMAALVLPLSLAVNTYAEEAAPATGTLDITITNIQDAKGIIHLSLQNSSDGWLSTDEDVKTFRDVSQEITSTDDIVISVEGLPEGGYAISLFHDLDGDLELDTNFIGFPKEPFGFSAPMGMTGPPKFEKAVVEVGANKTSVEIKLN
jgi:uncharacterized protein (DUF2141 family)